MSTQRDELSRAIHSTEQLGCGCCTDYSYTREQDQHADRLDVNSRAVAIADTLLAAGYRKPRTITTVAELRMLKDGAVVLSEQGGVWECQVDDGGPYWVMPGNSDEIFTSENLALPATVLHEPAQ